MTEVLIDRWGAINPSSLVAKHEGSCIDFVFNNTVTATPDVLSYVYEGHQIILEGNPSDQPDFFTVIPELGWEPLTDLVVSAPDAATTIITICQMFFS